MPRRRTDGAGAASRAALYPAPCVPEPPRVYPVSVALYSPVETNCIVGVEHEGSDGALFWTDAEATQPLQSLSGIALSAVTEQGGGSPYTFYMTSPNVGSGLFTAMFSFCTDMM